MSANGVSPGFGTKRLGKIGTGISIPILPKLHRPSSPLVARSGKRPDRGRVLGRPMKVGVFVTRPIPGTAADAGLRVGPGRPPRARPRRLRQGLGKQFTAPWEPNPAPDPLAREIARAAAWLRASDAVAARGRPIPEDSGWIPPGPGSLQPGWKSSQRSSAEIAARVEVATARRVPYASRSSWGIRQGCPIT